MNSAFSIQNRLRESTAKETIRVETLMIINLAPATEVLDFVTAVENWKAARQRRFFTDRKNWEGYCNSERKRKTTAVKGTSAFSSSLHDTPHSYVL